jgi:hypothetical protein
VLARVLQAHTWCHRSGYMPAGPGHRATSPTATHTKAPSKVPKILVLKMVNLDNAMLPMLAGVGLCPTSQEGSSAACASG